MAPPFNSLTTVVALAAQTAKGTPATSNFYPLRASRSRSIPEFDYIDNQNFHFGIHERVSQQSARPQRTAVMIPISVTASMMSDSFPVMLQAMGFNVATTTETGYRTHVLNKADYGTDSYISMLHRFGYQADAAEELVRNISDVKGTSLEINASRQGIPLTFDAVGLDEAETTVGTKVITPQPFELNPMKGSFAWNNLTSLSLPRTHVITIGRPVDEDDTKLHQYGRNDFPESGFTIEGIITGMTLNKDVYAEMMWDAGGKLSSEILLETFSFEFLGAETGAANVFHSVKFSFPLVEMRLTDFEAADNNTVLVDAEWRMIDEVATSPVTIDVVNTVAADYPDALIAPVASAVKVYNTPHASVGAPALTRADWTGAPAVGPAPPPHAFDASYDASFDSPNAP